MMYGFGNGYGPGHGMFFGGWIMWLIFIVIIGIMLFSFYGRSSCCGPKHSTGGETAEDILKKRYARGEITKEEYSSMKEDMRK